MFDMSIFYTHLDDRAVLHVHGSDVVDFLQNLITQDVTKCPPDGCMMAALLTPQGKVLHEFLLFGAEAGFLIDCDAGQADALLKKLSLYKLRADVSLEKTDMQVHALWQEDGYACPPAAGFIEDPRHEGLGLRQVSGAYQPSLPTKNLAAWHANRIAQGVPQGPDDMPPGTVFPLEFGLHHMHAIDFQKGCFVGQEVTSRTHRKGTLRKKLHVIACNGPVPPRNTDIMLGDRPVGEIVAPGETIALALIREDALDGDLSAAAAVISPIGGLFDA